ncbi:hypothetical protein GCM10007874_03030 [Labrys miyagiensis]|uniref:Endonuclease GajA/Old nuclease/RecF-like AAA domain-containing protein n=1 Tax=Labrys miyagiensis TaxID=346912 RepID=A0ABQ6CC88_9HYPH|nr:AAA family ATPase [Labrys miyagiensis]GLS17288.1 hypothetical protein GCM10007874_03030 [Labrys miyagiensis]
MHIETLRIQNFRRLRDVQIDLASDISIFVGANNSGKTSASHALQLFMAASRERFSVHDFSAECWATMDAFGYGVDGAILPTISLDVWFHVDAPDLHRVVDLLPSLAWEGTLVGLRVEFGVTDVTTLLANFREARERARANIRPGANGGADYHPSPRTLRDYLAAQAYEYCVLSFPFDSELDVVIETIRMMPHFVERPFVNGRRHYVVANETTIGENFAERWNTEPGRVTAFYAWHGKALADFEGLRDLEGVDLIASSLGKSLGNSIVGTVMDSRTQTVSQARVGSKLYVAPAVGLTLTTQANATQVRPNTFFGD